MAVDGELGEEEEFGHDLKHMERSFATLGFKEGIDAGEEAALQAGFNEGFRAGVAAGLRAGEVQGGEAERNSRQGARRPW